MKKISLLQNYVKSDGDNLHGYEWNSLMNDIVNIGEAKIEKMTDSGWTGVTVDLTNITLTAGEKYRISGYFNKKITVSGENATTLVLNNCAVITDEGTCIDYSASKKTLKVILSPGTENFLIQKSISNDYASKGALNSENDLYITGVGALYLENAIGHGARGSELDLRGDVTIVAKVQHDGFHGTKKLDLYYGDYYILDANDAFGTGERGEEEVGKLRGILRVYGGNVHIYKVRQKIFDAKCTSMIVDETNGLYYLPTDTIPSGSTTAYTLNSGIHTLHYTVDGPGVVFQATQIKDGITINSSNLCNNFVRMIPDTSTPGTVVGDGVLETETAFTISVENASIAVKGYISKPILCNAKNINLKLDNVLIAAPASGENANIAIFADISGGNVQLQPIKGSTNYIFGAVKSENNIKITPKKDSVLYIDAPGIGKDESHEGFGLDGSTVTYCDGNGSIYVTGFKVGSRATEQRIGDEAKLVGKKNGTERRTDAPLEGDIYIYGNELYDMQVRTNSDATKKGCIYVADDFKGNAFVGTIKPTIAYKASAFVYGQGNSIETGQISGEEDVNTNSKLYYKKNLGAAHVTKDCALQYDKIDGNNFVNKVK